MKSKLMIATVLICAGTFPALAQDATGSASVMDTSGNSLGTLSFTETDAGVQITGELSGVPNGEHGFHLHETGACDAADDFASAGGHFNPESKQHGFDNPEGPHAGDMRNITVGDDGNVSIDVVNDMVTLGDGDHSLNDEDGSAVMIHSGADDYMTDPGGDAGDRFACGVIEFAE